MHYDAPPLGDGSRDTIDQLAALGSLEVLYGAGPLVILRSYSPFLDDYPRGQLTRSAGCERELNNYSVPLRVSCDL